jgi:DNA polymerase-3 subunit beta
MKITFDKDVLEKAVSDSLCAVSEKNTYPALERIRFKCEENGKCLITTFDLNKGFLTEIDCTCEKGGNYLIEAQKLSKIIKFLPGFTVTINIDDKNIATITSGNAQFTLPVLEGASFPNLPNLDGDEGFSVKSSVIKKMIGEIFFAIAVTDQRPTLCGALFEVDGEKIKIVSCDGNRLAIREVKCSIENKTRSSDKELDMRFILPGRTLAQLTRLLADSEKPLTIHLGRQHVIFRIEEKIFFSRLTEGEYIDYTRVIPKEQKISAVVDRAAFISSLERASLISEERIVGAVRNHVKCDFSGDTLKVSSTSASGSVYDEFRVEKEGDDILIGFNCRYLLDALKSAEGEKVLIKMTSSLLSIIILPYGEEERDSEFLYMVCPLRIN